MKTNLDSIFKTDEEMEKTGIWFMVKDDVGFLVKRFGGKNSTQVKAALAKHSKQYARQIEAGTMEVEKEKEIMTKVFVESSLIGWQGIIIDGSPAEFSKEKAVQLLLELPELADKLISHATTSSNYREDVGNS